MSIHTPDKMLDADLVATILGKKAVDDECHHIAGFLAMEGSVAGALGERNILSTKLARIEASIELGRRTIAARAAREYITVSTPVDVVGLIGPLVTGLEVEKFFCLCLTTKMGLKKIVDISTGSINASIVHPRELFRTAVSLASASVIIAHNHPSGDPTPSQADVVLTRRLIRAGDVLGITVEDHVILGGGSHFSMQEENFMS
jgi:DNA repair protein RadC